MTGTKTDSMRSGGFTLVELLVVISIIAILAGLAMSGVLKGKLSGEESAVKHNLTALGSRIEQYANELGDYPPSSLVAFGIPGNGANEGIECVLACLQTRKHNGPFIDDLDPDQRSNADEDHLTKLQVSHVRKRLDWSRQNDKLWEYCDRWGNPLIYIHSRDYGKQFKVQRRDGEVLLVSAKKDPETGGYYKPTEYQLWSLGVDEISGDEYGEGEGDDIYHWKQR